MIMKSIFPFDFIFDRCDPYIAKKIFVATFDTFPVTGFFVNLVQFEIVPIHSESCLATFILDK